MKYPNQSNGDHFRLDSFASVVSLQFEYHPLMGATIKIKKMTLNQVMKVGPAGFEYHPLLGATTI